MGPKKNKRTYQYTQSNVTQTISTCYKQSEVTRPKILAVSPRDPKMDTASKAAGMQQIPDEWDSTPTESTNMENAMAPPSYASTNGHGMPIVYDREGLSEAQQITLENLHWRRARNQRQRRERARQGSDDEKEKEESSEETAQQENCDQEVTG